MYLVCLAIKAGLAWLFDGGYWTEAQLTGVFSTDTEREQLHHNISCCIDSAPLHSNQQHACSCPANLSPRFS